MQQFGIQPAYKTMVVALTVLPAAAS